MAVPFAKPIVDGGPVTDKQRYGCCGMAPWHTSLVTLVSW